MTALAEKECVPCKGEVAPLKGDELARLTCPTCGIKYMEFRVFAEYCGVFFSLDLLAEGEVISHCG